MLPVCSQLSAFTTPFYFYTRGLCAMASQENSLTGELAAKFHDCAQGILTSDAEHSVLDLIYRLDNVANAAELTSLLRA